jgi:cytochrome bd-type quinol oxidase subunit 1
MVAASLAVFVLLYITLGVVDFLLMRRYARLDPPKVGEGGGLGATAGVPESTPALGY